MIEKCLKFNLPMCDGILYVEVCHFVTEDLHSNKRN